MIVFVILSVGLLTKAILEAAYFKDRKSSSKTLFLWCYGVGVLLMGSGFAFLIDYFG